MADATLGIGNEFDLGFGGILHCDGLGEGLAVEIDVGEVDAIRVDVGRVDWRQRSCRYLGLSAAVGCASGERTALEKILHRAVGLGVAGAAPGLGAGVGAGAVCVSERLTVMRWLSSESAGTFGSGWESPQPAMRFILSGDMA